MSMSIKASPDGTYGEILVNGAVVAKLPVTGNAVIPGLVGTVSQSGGVPTGAIIERGSNANGEYVRYADGTQICTAVFETTLAINTGPLDGWFYNIVTRPFPASFSGLPVVSTGARLTGYLTHVVAQDATTTTFGAFLVLPVGRGAGVYQIRYVAIGRWF